MCRSTVRQTDRQTDRETERERQREREEEVTNPRRNLLASGSESSDWFMVY